MGGALRLLFFADVHLDAAFRWAGPDLGRTLRRGLRDAVTSVVRLAGECPVDALVCAGDLYEHDRVTPDTVAFLRDAFESLHPLPVLLAPGNHDWFGPTSAYATTGWSDNVHVFADDTLGPLRLADGFTVWGAAHRNPANTAGFLRGFRAFGDGVHVGLFHGSDRSHFSFSEDAKERHAPFNAEEVPAAGLDHALVGHFHAPCDGEWHTYPGNPAALGFGETGERGAVLVTVHADGSVARERHVVGTTVLADVDLDVTGCTSAQGIRERARESLAGHGGAVRLMLHGELASGVDLAPEDLADVAPWVDAVLPTVVALRSGYDIEAVATERSTLRGQFVAKVLAADLDDEEARRVAVTGLRALDGRSDLEVF